MDIELCVKSCGMHQNSANMPHPGEWPGRPWFWMHMDDAGPIKGKWILVIVDAPSKYMHTSCHHHLQKQCCDTYLPHISDNASSFTSKEFSKVCALNGIKHVKCAPYHTSSNGLAKHTVQTIKSGLKVPGDLESLLLCVLAQYVYFHNQQWVSHQQC